MDPCDCTTKNLSGKAEPTAERYPRLNPSKKLAKHVLDPSDWTKQSPCHPELDSGSVQRCKLKLSVSLARFRNGLVRLAKNATVRACNQERAGQAGFITSRSVATTYCGCASGTACRALDSTQGKPCSVALLGLAFTMAEILLSLTIIGVVAAITLPSLTGNINERTWNAQKNALYSRMSQAMALMPVLSGFGTLQEESSSGANDGIDNAAETFVTNGLAKVLKINNICDSEHLSDCGIPDKYTNMIGENLSWPKTLMEMNQYFNPTYGISIDVKAAAFETVNGESVAVYYNPRCVQELPLGRSNTYYPQRLMCANFIYDLNGRKGPNSFGKDIGFIVALRPLNPQVLATIPLPANLSAGYGYTQEIAKTTCRNAHAEGRLGTLEEYIAIFYNQKLVGDFSYQYHTATDYSRDSDWRIEGDGKVYTSGKNNRIRARCVRR